MNQKSIDDAVKQKFLDLQNWADNMLEQLEHNFESQQVWPMGYPGPYPGYQYSNAKRRRAGGKSWVSTGDAFRTMYAQVYQGAGPGSRSSTARIEFFFRYYLMFVDMGVGGKGGVHERVDNSAKAHWGRLYKKWGTDQQVTQKKENGKTTKVETKNPMLNRRSRPHLMMEFRHQLTRLELIVTNYYSQLGRDDLYKWIYSMNTEGFEE